MAKIGFIGMGNMGYAMLKGLLKICDSSEIIITDVNEERMMKVAKELKEELIYYYMEFQVREKVGLLNMNIVNQGPMLNV